ncbi:MAG: monofunctional biosynthetic peptidoglycan transglycosylase [bacterium]
MKYWPFIWKMFRRFVMGGVSLSVLWVILYNLIALPGTPLMGWRQLQGQPISYQWVGLDDISPQLSRAVIAAEDNKFCRHIGFDFGEIRVVLHDAWHGSKLRGASTISQQTAKNAFLWPGRDPIRKTVEVWFTGLEELLWSKRRIMEIYLNIAEWGEGAFGAEAAAQKYFGKSARDLTAYEASLLAAALPNPNNWQTNPPDLIVAKRAERIRKRMADIRRYEWDSCLYRK